MRVLGVIPARLESSRLPRKLLLDRTGRPLVQYAWQAATAAAAIDEVVVATDSDEIARVVRGFGGEVVLTGSCESGTDRAAVVARQRPEFDLVVNVQGDEPELPPQCVDDLVAAIDGSTAEMATLATPLTDPGDVLDPACVKVVTAADGRALYFSRSVIPHLRDRDPVAWATDRAESDLPVEDCPWLLHVGVYAYRREFLIALAEMPPSRLERFEKLEQLRALEAGASIKVATTAHRAVGIDTPDDYDRFVARDAFRKGAAAPAE